MNTVGWEGAIILLCGIGMYKVTAEILDTYQGLYLVYMLTCCLFVKLLSTPSISWQVGLSVVIVM
uniref:Uncharacterized protein n=1 Tax=Arundo donax TaxID=35708 RepID=A0A0A9DK86_ARUDO